MKKPRASAFLFALLLLSFSQTPAHSSLSGPELDDESEFDYVEGSGKGPEDWWHLEEGWGICKFGQRQSPINLEDAVLDWTLGQLKTSYWSNDAILKNRGHDVMLEWPGGAGDLEINGIRYTLRQSHWHAPSEHEINGIRHDLEMHTVYQDPHNSSHIAVVGVLYKYGKCDPFLAKLEGAMNTLVGGQISVTVGRVTPWRVEGRQPYFRYKGSLTTPPCTEGVVWTVLAEVRTVCEKQVQLLRNAVADDMKNNSRPIQPTNGRLVRLFVSYTLHEEHASA